MIICSLSKQEVKVRTDIIMWKQKYMKRDSPIRRRVRHTRPDTFQDHELWRGPMWLFNLKSSTWN